LGRTTFTRRVLPLVEKIELPWGMKLIPVDELERLLAELRRVARGRPQPARPGRPASLAPVIVDRIRGERAGGESLGEIARDLNASRISTRAGQRAVVAVDGACRSRPLGSARDRPRPLEEATSASFGTIG
jgi:hypothetical protein